MNIRYKPPQPDCRATSGRGEIKRQKWGTERWKSGEEEKPKKECRENISRRLPARLRPRLIFRFNLLLLTLSIVLPHFDVWSLILALRACRPCYWSVTQPTAIDLRSFTITPVTFHGFQLFDNLAHHLSTRWSGIKFFTSARVATWNAAFVVFSASNAIKALAP